MKIKDLCASERPREKMLSQGVESLSNGELLAVLIDRNGAGVTAREICACMWADGSNDRKNINYLYQLFFDLRHTLELAGASEILRKDGVYYAVDTERIDCDYYHYLNTGKPEFHGEYMTQYSWAENTAGLLWNK